LATELGLQGYVNNSAQGVTIEVEGPGQSLEQFLLRLEAEQPPRSFIQGLEASWLDTVGYGSFEIRHSEAGGQKTALVLPDIASCPECVNEVFDPKNRRYFYPFTNCTNCGPRFSIIDALPYDRVNTSMRSFVMCERCLAEYQNPLDRRFHAQPNACPACGPTLALWDARGRCLIVPSQGSRDILQRAADVVREGRILAVKGLGGFHLMGAADNEQTVRRLRELKHREEKPFALMFPSLASIERECYLSSGERRVLCSAEAPILLLRRSEQTTDVCSAVAPGNPFLGAMLPYTPLHHLLLSVLGCPVVATSGNLSDEPICIDEQEAVERLGGIADFFLVHNRPIVRHVDDSIVRMMAGREMVIRRARGYAPFPITLHNKEQSADKVLAVGAHLKNAIALSSGSQVFISQHIGDLETDQAYSAFQRVISDFENLFETRPAVIAADAHPDYLSTCFARGATDNQPGRDGPHDKSSDPALPRLFNVQHHLAHVLACAAENEVPLPALGVSWDGTGYGMDGTIWGGEFLLVSDNHWERVAHVRTFPLPGGDKAIKEPRRTALGLLFECFGEDAFSMDVDPIRAFSGTELVALKTILHRGLNSLRTSSMGRLFDAIASLIGLRHRVRFEGQAAMELEFALRDADTGLVYSLPYKRGTETTVNTRDRATVNRPYILDWSELIKEVIEDRRTDVPTSTISAKFHNSLVEAIVEVARHVGQPRVVLSGGCFQNQYLTERTIRRLRQEGFQPYWHQRVPPNDGGICLGQVVAVVQNLCSSESLPLGV
jgi:hydrogenase maturation protein HypF